MMSHFQSEVITIPRFEPTDKQSVNFIGRVSRELIAMTSTQTTTYVNQMSGWFDQFTGKYVCSLDRVLCLGMFALSCSCLRCVCVMCIGVLITWVDRG